MRASSFSQTPNFPRWPKRRDRGLRDAAAEAERARTQIARAELLARRDALQVEADDVCERWRESYGVRAARHTRA